MCSRLPFTDANEYAGSLWLLTSRFLALALSLLVTLSYTAGRSFLDVVLPSAILYAPLLLLCAYAFVRSFGPSLAHLFLRPIFGAEGRSFLIVSQGRLHF